ncbi:hypothetical protein [Glaciihabitans sp. UYNi722]|uniref:hypothetical protein n=1 Tax=Glaciihabitans sp. UYNi722 TaxID=3156344 RepID=UPI003398BD9E
MASVVRGIREPWHPRAVASAGRGCGLSVSILRALGERWIPEPIFVARVMCGESE